MRHTENPLAYTFAKPRAKGILYALEGASSQPYSSVREQAALDPKTFKRITQRLAQFNLIHQRAPRDAEVENNRVRIVLELTDHGREVLQTLHDLDRVLKDHAVALGRGMTDPLLVGAE